LKTIGLVTQQAHQHEQILYNRAVGSFLSYCYFLCLIPLCSQCQTCISSSGKSFR